MNIKFYKLFLTLLLLTTGGASFAQLTTGDFAIIGFNGNAVTVNLAIVALKEIPSATILKITDQGWNQSALVANASDGLITWTTNNIVPAGTILNIAITGGSTPTATGLQNYGTAVVSGWAAGTVVAGGGDSWFLYTGSDSNPTFIYGFANWSTVLPGTFSPNPTTGWQAGGPVTAAVSYLPTTLAAGNFFITLTIAGTPPTGYHGDYNSYSGSFSGTKASILAALALKSNWATTETLANKKSLDPGGAAFPGANPIFQLGTNISGVSSSKTNGPYKTGDVIDINITFSSIVTVTGTPTLGLNSGATVNYSGGSGTNTLTFNYTIGSGQSAPDLDYASTTALSLNGATIKDGTNTDATLTLAAPGAANSLGNNKNIVIDGVAPIAPSAPFLTVGSDTGTRGDNTTSINTPTFTGTAEAGATITLYEGTTVLATATADGSGNWQIAPSSALSATTHTLTAQATDVAGNVSSVSTGVTITIDNIAPNAPSAPFLAVGSDTGTRGDNTTSINTPTFTGTAEAGATITLYEGTTVLATATADGSGNWQIAPSSALSATTHTLTAQATDVAGNVSSVSTGVTITIDNIAPNAPSAPFLAVASDTGTRGDNTTSINTPTFTGTAEAGATITLYEGTTVLATATADGSGNWQIAPSSALSATTHTLTAQATDVAGNVSSVSTGVTITIDNIAPNAPSAPFLAVGSDTGTRGDNTTSINTPTFTGTAEAGATITLYEGTTVLATATADGSGNWQIAPSSALSATTHTLTAQAIDVAGNVSSVSTGLTITIDNIAPNAPSAPFLAVGSDTGTRGDNTTSINTPTFTGTAEAGATITLYEGTTVLATATADGSGNWQIAPSSALSATTHTLTAQATDVAGNVSSVSTGVTITIDNIAPNAPSAPFLAVGSDTGTRGDNTTSINTPTLTGTAEAGATITLYEGTTVLATATADGSGNWQIAPSSALSATTHTLTAQATDVAGNVSSVSTGLTITIDNIAPNAPSAPFLAVGSDTGTRGDNTTSINTPTFTGTAEAGATITLYEGTTVLATATADGSGNWQIAPSSALSATTHTLTAQATDVAGNVSSVSTGLTITIDNIAPNAPSAPFLAVGSDTGTRGDNTTSINTPTLTGTAEAGATITLYEGTTVLATATADGSGNWQIAPSSALSATTHTLTAQAIDVAGNVSSVSTGLTITIDNTAPNAPSAPFLAVGSDTGTRGDNTTSINTPTFTGTAEAGATITLYEGTTVLATATADGSGNWQIAPSSALSATTHTLTAQATDVAGNVSSVSTGLTITIDNIAPNAPSAPFLAVGSDTGTRGDNTTSINTPTLTGTAEAGATITLYEGTTVLATATADGSGNWQIAPSSALSATTHTLTAQAIDVAGNVSSVSTGLTITIDNTAPAAPLVSLPTNGSTVLVAIPEVKGTAEPGSVLTINMDGSVVSTTLPTDGSGNWTYTSSTLPNGAHTVKALATDASGNTGVYSNTNTFTINIDPTITTTGTLSALTTTYGTASASTNFTVSGVNMNAGILVTPPSGFEVSIDNTTFTSTVTAGAAGVISQIVYVRLKNTAAANTYTGANITLSSAGATQVTQATPTSMVSTLAITVTADAKSKTYGDSDPGFTYSVTSGALVNSDTFTGALTRNAGEAVDPYTITMGTLTLGDNYSVTYVPANLTIGKRAVIVTSDAKSKIYGDADPAFTYTITNGTLSGSDAFTGALTRNSGEGIGAYPIAQGTLTLGNNYVLSYLPASLNITAKIITVNATAKTKVYGDIDPTLMYSFMPALNGTDLFTGALDRAIGENAGSYIIGQGTLSAGTNYTLAFNSADLTITKKPLTITANNQTKVYGAVNPALTLSFSGFSGSDDAAGLTTQPKISTSATATSSVAGSPYPITATGAVSSNYTINYVAGGLSVTTAPLTITADNKTKIFGAANPTLTASYNGFVNGDTQANLTTQPILSTSATATSSVAGSPYPITATAAVSSNYTISYVAGGLLVTTAPLTITADNKTKIFGAANPTLTASYNGFVNGDTQANLTTQPTLSTSATPASVSGTYPITATAASSVNYSIAYLPGTLTVANNSQVISFGALANKLSTDATLTLTATASSGLIVSYSSSNPAVARIVNGNQVQILSAGVVNITASQPGDINYLPAPNVIQAFTILDNPAPVITILSSKGSSISKGETLQLTASGALSYQWNNGNSIINGQTSAVLTVRPSITSSYTVTGTNQYGRTSSQVISIEVKSDFAVLNATNILSPNGDGVNDVWKIENIDLYPDNEVKIFDRAGKSIYSVKGYQNDWSGTFNGANLAEGTYYYIVDFGKAFGVKKGFITIVR